MPGGKGGDGHRLLRSPSLGEVDDLVTEAVRSGSTVTLTGRCEVTYEGRASSVLGPGDRLVVSKPDGSVLVHQNRGREPVNWMGPGTRPSPTLKDDVFRLKSRRRDPPEELVVDLSEVYEASSVVLSDAEERELYGQEDAMRDRVADNPDLLEEGFRVLEVERSTDYGRIDVYGRDGDGVPVVVELKRDRVSPKDVDQILRYMEDVENDGFDEVRGVFMAPGMATQAGNRARDHGIEFVRLEPETEVERKDSSLDEFV